MSKRIIPLNFRHMTIKCIQNTRKLMAMYATKSPENSEEYYNDLKYALMEVSKMVDKFESSTKETEYSYGCELVDHIREQASNYDEKTKKNINRFLSGVLSPLLAEENRRNQRTNKFIFPNKKISKK